MSDEKFRSLLSGAKSGDQDSLLELVLCYQASLGQFVAKQMGNHLASTINEDDILQESFVHALNSIEKFQGDKQVAFVAWLKAIAMNRVRDAARKSAAAKRGGEMNQVFGQTGDAESRAFELMNELSGDGYTPSFFAARREAVSAINAALIVLPNDQREAIRLHCIEKLTIDETAEKMNRSRDSVRGLVQRGKESLRINMEGSSKWFSRR